LATALITVLAIEFRLYLNRVAAGKVKENLGDAYINVNLKDGKTVKVPIQQTDIAGYVAGIPESKKVGMSLGGAFTLCLLTYILLYHVFGFGSGMLCFNNKCDTSNELLYVEGLLLVTGLAFSLFWMFFVKQSNYKM